jgi:membrane fusion protein, hemolysin D
MATASLRLPLPSRSHSEREFLPAALEIIETPASPAGRAIAGAIITFFVLALTWAVLGWVDIVATAPGKIVPAGRSKVIQPLDSGIVHAIHVQNGQMVKAGDLLIELDPTESEADRNRLAGELLAARLEAARLEAMLSGALDPSAIFVAPPGTDPAQVALSRQLVGSAMAEFSAKLAELDQQAAQHEANRVAVTATIEKLNAVLPLLREQLDMRKVFYERNVGSKLDYLDAQERVLEMERDLAVQRSRLSEAQAAAAADAESRRETEAERRRSWLAALADAQVKVQALVQDFVKADERMRRQVLSAPIDGVVQQLAVHTIGGVVKPADTLLVLVPIDSGLEIEAVIANADIGFVHPGQSAKIKVDTFTFTRYGLIDGKLQSVSPDSTPEAGVSDAPDARTRSREPGFTARVGLDRTSMKIGDQAVPLRPGMAVTVEINTGERRIIDYLLSPLLRYTQESMRER